MVKSKRQTEKIARRKALESWSKAVRERDSWTCQICGNTKYINSHHIVPKEIKEFRTELNNGVTLCPICHKFGQKSAHKNALWFIVWLQRHKPVQYDYLLWNYASKVLESGSKAIEEKL